MTSKSKVEVASCTDEDIPTCFEVVSKSFGHDAAFVDIYLPNHETEAGRVQGSARFLEWKRASTDTVFLKAVVPGNHIAGMAVWTYMKEPPPAELEKVEKVDDIWPDKDDREFMTLLWKEYVIPRSEAIKNAGDAGVWVLELLAVHPDYQRLGAGTALVKWGTDAADKDGVDAVVEGTPKGRKTYENGGFKAEIEEMSFDLEGKYADRRKPVLVFMRKAIHK